MIEILTQIAQEAAHQILDVYNAPGVSDHSLQEDGSPLTEADDRAHRLIVAALSSHYPDIPIISEEDEGRGVHSAGSCQRFFLVDPLDGTKEFLKRNGEFTVNIALVEAGRPVCGVVLAPVLQLAYLAEQGSGAFRQDAAGNRTPLRMKPAESTGVRIVGSRSHATPELQTLLARFSGALLVSKGSSLKFCLVAEGSADLYPRHAPTSWWDTAAGQCVVEQAGGCVLEISGEPLSYGRTSNVLNPSFIAGLPELVRQAASLS